MWETMVFEGYLRRILENMEDTLQIAFYVSRACGNSAAK